MTLLQDNARKRVLIRDVSWDLYQHMLREIGDGHVRLTYDEGRLEIMSPSGLHENVKKVLGRLAEACGEEIGVAVEGFGSVTLDREDLHKGLEPDECYYIANAAKVIGRDKLDMTVDPPPDLAIEVDISPPSVLRQPVYAALGVPEIWRFDGRIVTALIRVDDTGGPGYVPAEKSLAFPNLSMAEVNRLLQIGLKFGQTAAVKALREWLRSPSGA